MTGTIFLACRNCPHCSLSFNKIEMDIESTVSLNEEGDSNDMKIIDLMNSNTDQIE